MLRYNALNKINAIFSSKVIGLYIYIYIYEHYSFGLKQMYLYKLTYSIPGSYFVKFFLYTHNVFFNAHLTNTMIPALNVSKIKKNN